VGGIEGTPMNWAKKNGTRSLCLEGIQYRAGENRPEEKRQLNVGRVMLSCLSK